MLCPICNAQNPAGALACAACGTPLDAPDATVTSLSLPLGTSLQDGAYLIQHVLGQGGFGITYLGHDTRLRRPVAIKEFFPPGCLRQNSSVQLTGATSVGQYATIKGRFLEEARTLAQFHHPGIVDVYTCFEENNTAYMVMEFLQGKTLLRRLEEHNAPLDEAEAVGYIRSIATALQVVHGAGLLHRDLKPDNIMVCPDGRAVLIDFGTAKEYVAGKTQNHSIIVTPGYAPLEQYAQRAQRGTYTDIYALAATLYHLLTGELPIAASDRAMGVELPPIQQSNPTVSEAVAAAVRAGLSIEIAERPQTVADFLARLDGVSINEVDFTPVKPAQRARSDFERVYGLEPSPYRSAPAVSSPPKATAPIKVPPPGFNFLNHIQANAGLTPTSLVVPQATPTAPATSSQPAGASSQSNAVANRLVPPLRNTSQSPQNDALSFLYLGSGFLMLCGLLWVLSVMLLPPHPNPPGYFTNTHEPVPSYFLDNDTRSHIYNHEPQPGYPVYPAVPEFSAPKEVHLHEWDMAAIQANAFSPDGKLIAAASAEADTIKLWATQTGTVREVLETPAEHIRALTISPNDKLLAIAPSDTNLCIWDLHAGAKKWDAGAVGQAVAFAPNGKLLAYSLLDQYGRGFIKLCDAGTGTTRLKLQVMPDVAHVVAISSNVSINHLAYSPDGKFMAGSSNDGVIRLWEASSGHLKWTHSFDCASVTDLAFNSQGTRLASAEAIADDLWATYMQDAKSGELIYCLSDLPGRDGWVAFAPDGQALAIGSLHHPLALWPTHSTQAITLTPTRYDYRTWTPTDYDHRATATKAMFAPDSHHLLALDATSAVLCIWQLPPHLK